MRPDEKGDRVDEYELPRGFSASKMIARARQHSSLIAPYINKKLEVVRIRDISKMISERFGFKDSDPVDILLAQYQDRVLTARLSRRIMMKILANQETLQQGKKVPTWHGDEPVWTCAKVIGCKQERVNNINIVNTQVLALSNFIAGNIYRFRLTVRYVIWLLIEIGCPRFEPLMPEDLDEMVMYTRLGLNSHDHFYVLQVRASGTQKKNNRKLYRERNDEHGEDQ